MLKQLRRDAYRIDGSFGEFEIRTGFEQKIEQTKQVGFGIGCERDYEGHWPANFFAAANLCSSPLITVAAGLN